MVVIRKFENGAGRPLEVNSSGAFFVYRRRPPAGGRQAARDHGLVEEHGDGERRSPGKERSTW